MKKLYDVTIVSSAIVQVIADSPSDASDIAYKMDTGEAMELLSNNGFEVSDVCEAEPCEGICVDGIELTENQAYKIYTEMRKRLCADDIREKLDERGESLTETEIMSLAEDVLENLEDNVTYCDCRDGTLESVLDDVLGKSSVSCESYKNAQKVISVVDEALRLYAISELFVEEAEGMINLVVRESRYESQVYMADIAPYFKCNLDYLEKQLEKRGVSFEW